MAGATEGFSGADLQALVYNAHLEVVHSSLGDRSDTSRRENGDIKEKPLKYTIFGGEKKDNVVSRAEREALEKRVRLLR